MQPDWNSQLDELLVPRDWMAADAFLIERLFDKIDFADTVLEGFERVVRSPLPDRHVAEVFSRLLRGQSDYEREDLIVSPKEWGAEMGGEVHRALVDLLAERQYRPVLESAWSVSHGRDASVYYESVVYSLQTLSGMADVPHHFISNECIRALRGSLCGYRNDYDMMRIAVSDILSAYAWNPEIGRAWEVLVDDHGTNSHDKIRELALERLAQVRGVPDDLLKMVSNSSRLRES